PVRALDPQDMAARARDVRLPGPQVPALAALRHELVDGCAPHLHGRPRIVRPPATLQPPGVWRSLVARSVRVGEVPSSNLGTPITAWGQTRGGLTPLLPGSPGLPRNEEAVAAVVAAAEAVELRVAIERAGVPHMPVGHGHEVRLLCRRVVEHAAGAGDAALRARRQLETRPVDPNRRPA